MVDTHRGCLPAPSEEAPLGSSPQSMRPEFRNPRRLLAGVIVAGVAFAVLGTVAAVWENPFFIRMTVVSGWEIALLAILSLMSGLYVVIRRPACSIRGAGLGGVLGFLGIACPICNKILLMLFGTELLLTYFEPIRIYVALSGVAVLAWAIWREWLGWVRLEAESQPLAS